MRLEVAVAALLLEREGFRAKKILWVPSDEAIQRLYDALTGPEKDAIRRLSDNGVYLSATLRYIEGQLEIESECL